MMKGEREEGHLVGVLEGERLETRGFHLVEDDDRGLRVKGSHELLTEDHLGDDGDDLVGLDLCLFAYDDGDE